MAINSRFSKIIFDQKGFSLMQLIIGMAITTILGTVITISLWQTINIDGASNKHMLAISQVDNAIFYLNRDVQMSVPVDGYSSGFPLALKGGITYSIISPHDGSPSYLQRNNNGVTQVIARYINTDANLTSSFYNEGKLIITLTITTGGMMSATESRTLAIMPRLNQ
jgi:hypothetical protein